MPLRITELLVGPGREEHIARHPVTVAEVQEVVSSYHFARKGRGGYMIIGQTESGRYLTLFLAPRGGGIYSLMTARDANEWERRLYRRSGARS